MSLGREVLLLLLVIIAKQISPRLCRAGIVGIVWFILKARLPEPKRVVWGEKRRGKDKSVAAARILEKAQHQLRKKRRKIEAEQARGVYDVNDSLRAFQLRDRVTDLTRKWLKIDAWHF